MRHKPSLYRNITSATLYLFDRQALVLRSLLKFYLLLIVVTLFLLNGIFIDFMFLSCHVRVSE